SLASRHGPRRGARGRRQRRALGRGSVPEVSPGRPRARGHRMNGRSRIGDWLDARTGYRALVTHALDEPVPGGARWAYIWGSVLVGCITLQAITGWAMMAYYAPSATTAWA